MIRKGLLLSLVPLGLIVALGAYGYGVADPAARFPVHWGLDGAPDRYGSRAEAFLGLPALALGLTAVFAALPALDPRGSNLRRSAQPYLIAWLGTLALLALLQLGLTLIAVGAWADGPRSPFNRLIAAAVSILVILTSNGLGKTRPNWFLGVRTPWALSSDLAWERTQRLSGRLLVLAGLAGLIAAVFLPLAWALPVLLGGVLAAAVVSTIHSYLVWRSAPDKRTGPQVPDN